MKEINFNKFYGYYKKLPIILLLGTIILFFIWAIVNVSVIAYERMPYNAGISGIMRIGGYKEAWVEFILWIIIGTVVGGIAYFLCAVSISQKIMLTENIINIRKKIFSTCEETEEIKQTGVVNQESLTEADKESDSNPEGTTGSEKTTA